MNYQLVRECAERSEALVKAKPPLIICPFCGAETTLISLKFIHGANLYRRTCQSCNLSGPTCHSEYQADQIFKQITFKNKGGRS